MIFPALRKKLKQVTFQLIWLVVFIMNFYVPSVEAQTKKSDGIIIDTCETSKATLHYAIQDFQKIGKAESYFVIIGGAMKGEKSSHNNRRIHEAI